MIKDPAPLTDAFFKVLRNYTTITEFSPQAFGVLVESVKVRQGKKIDFSFVDGSKARV